MVIYTGRYLFLLLLLTVALILWFIPRDGIATPLQNAAPTQKKAMPLQEKLVVHHYQWRGRDIKSTNRIIVQFQDHLKSRSYEPFIKNLVDIQAFPKSVSVRNLAFNIGVISIERATKAEMRSMIDLLNQSDDVLYAMPDYVIQPEYVPNDAYLNMQWHFLNQTIAGINLPAAWDIAFPQGMAGSRLSEVKVAVVDTGILPHEDLSGQILPGYDFISDPLTARDQNGRDPDPTDVGDWVVAGGCGNGLPLEDAISTWHGTVISGIIAAVADNNKGVAGIAPHAKIIPVRVNGRCGGSVADALEAVLWVTGELTDIPGISPVSEPADIVNMSWGVPAGPCEAPLQSIFQKLHEKDVVLISASGNNGLGADNQVPANCNHVISVGAVTKDGQKASYSNVGNSVDLMAPGGDSRVVTSDGILSTSNNGTQVAGADDYIIGYIGTSFAAAHVSGVAALMKGIAPDSTAQEIEEDLIASAKTLPACNSCGAGGLDALAAVKKAVNRSEAGVFSDFWVVLLLLMFHKFNRRISPEF